MWRVCLLWFSVALMMGFSNQGRSITSKRAEAAARAFLDVQILTECRNKKINFNEAPEPKQDPIVCAKHFNNRYCLQQCFWNIFRLRRKNHVNRKVLRLFTKLLPKPVRKPMFLAVLDCFKHGIVPIDGQCEQFRQSFLCSKQAYKILCYPDLKEHQESHEIFNSHHEEAYSPSFFNESHIITNGQHGKL